MLNDCAGVVLEGAPIPPSSNHQYKSFVRHGRIVHVRSPDLVKYRLDFTKWALVQSKGIEVAKAVIEGCAIEVEAFFGFHVARLYTKKGTFKKLDVSNRIKALHDALAAALCVDDSHFFSITAEKFTVENAEDEQCVIRISPFSPRHVGDSIGSLIL